jgi:O-antigen/teichoic acid export membrane protein
MAALTLIASALNYLSSAVFSRILDPVGFGDLTSLLALAVILAVPTGAAQTVVAERVAFHAAAGEMGNVRYLIRHAFGHVVTIGAIVTGVYVACIPLVIDLFNLRVPGPAIALSGVILLSFVVPFAFGVLQGLDRFVMFGLLLVAVSLARIVFGVSWAALGGGSGGAIAGQALGMVVVVVLSAWVLRDLLMGRGTGMFTRGVRRRLDVRAISASAAFVAFAVISNLDILLAKVFLSREDVGLYAALATLGKVVTFLPAAIAVAMVPNAARAASAREGGGHRVLRLSAGLVAATAVVAAVPALVAPEFVIKVMFGPDYVDAVPGVIPILIAGAALAMLNLLVVYSVAIREQRWALFLGVGVVVQAGGAALFHDSPAQIATVQAVATVTVLALNEWFSHSLVRAPSR